jgi:TrmH family RNA methyltransferase
MAVHAKDILAGARVVKNLSDAVESADLVVGTTGKRPINEQRHLRLYLRVPYLTPCDLGEKLKDKKCTVALLLGREDCGLTNEELEQCDLVVSIPTSDSYPVMNLSHAATVLLYELSQVTGGRTEADLASGESMRMLRARMGALLREINYPAHKLDYVNLMLRRIFGRAELTEREVNTLMGILKNTLWMIKGRKDASGRGPEDVQEQV